MQITVNSSGGNAEEKEHGRIEKEVMGPLALREKQELTREAARKDGLEVYPRLDEGMDQRDTSMDS